MKFVMLLLLFMLAFASIAAAHEAFINLIGNVKVEVAPNSLSPLTGDNFTATVDFTDLNSSKELYLPYSVKIYNETDQIAEIDNLATVPAKISAFNYTFQKEGVYFFVIVIPGQGQTDFPIFARTQGIPGIYVVIAAGIAAIVGFFVGKISSRKSRK